MANEALKTGGAIFLLGYLLGRRKFRRAVQLGMFTATRQLGASPRELVTAGVRRLAGSEEVRDAGKSIGGQLVMAALTAPAGRLAESLHRRNAELSGGGRRGRERGDEQEGGGPGDRGEEDAERDWQRRGPDRGAESGNGYARDRREDDGEEEDGDAGQEEEQPARRSRRPAARADRGSRGTQRTAKSASPRRTSRTGAGRQRGAQTGRGAGRNPSPRQSTRATSGTRGGGRQKATPSARARRTRAR